MNERRDRFRKAMARFEPSGDPMEALTKGFYVEEPAQSVAKQIVARLELRPHSSHLVVGPIGSGKTTQLRVMEELLRQGNEFWPIFVDVTTQRDELRAPGSLIQHLLTEIKDIKSKALVKQTHDGAPGPGLLLFLAALAALAVLAESNTTSPEVNEVTLKREIAAMPQKPVLLIDSLDRLDHLAFATLCKSDLATLREFLAVVVVGPPAIMYGAARETAEGFDYFARQTAQDPREDIAARDFLMQVLHARADEALLPDPPCEQLVYASGGILRDLIALTQLALEEAYVAGHERVDHRDAVRAVDTFGRKHIIGLDSNELATLQRVRTRGTFVRVSDSDVGLLVTRRVLEYADEHGATRFAVHPALVPLLEQLDAPQ